MGGQTSQCITRSSNVVTLAIFMYLENQMRQRDARAALCNFVRVSLKIGMGGGAPSAAETVQIAFDHQSSPAVMHTHGTASQRSLRRRVSAGTATTTTQVCK